MKIIITESQLSNLPFEDFVSVRMKGANKIATTAKEKGGPSMLTYHHFHVKQPYYKKASTEDDTTDVIMADEPIGCISRRSGELFVNNIREPIYYIDHLIIQRKKDLRGISRKLFETHIYKTNVISKMELLLEPIMVYLFRRDRELLSGIVPLVRFTVATYVLPNNTSFYTQTRLPEHVVLVDIHSGNMDLLLDLLNASRTLFHVFAITDISNLIGFVEDIQGVFEQVKKVCHPNTKIIVQYYNSLWEPILKFAELVGIKEKTPLRKVTK
jgi:hypothetical protein